MRKNTMSMTENMTVMMDPEDMTDMTDMENMVPITLTRLFMNEETGLTWTIVIMPQKSQIEDLSMSKTHDFV